MQEQRNELIDQSDFDAWKQDRVTREVFRLLNLEREDINLSLTDATVILGPESHNSIPLLVGERNGLDRLLQISFEDIGDSSHEE